jgi:hypothetical protein
MAKYYGCRRNKHTYTLWQGLLNLSSCNDNSSYVVIDLLVLPVIERMSAICVGATRRPVTPTLPYVVYLLSVNTDNKLTIQRGSWKYSHNTVDNRREWCMACRKEVPSIWNDGWEYVFILSLIIVARWGKYMKTWRLAELWEINLGCNGIRKIQTGNGREIYIVCFMWLNMHYSLERRDALRKIKGTGR